MDKLILLILYGVKGGFAFRFPPNANEVHGGDTLIGSYGVGVMNARRLPDCDITTLTQEGSGGLHFRTLRFRAELGKMAGATKRHVWQRIWYNAAIDLELMWAHLRKRSAATC